MAIIPAPTTGLGVSAKVAVDESVVTLSVTGANSVPETHQIVAQIEDASGAKAPGPTALVLTAAANASGGTTAYTGTITGGASNALVGKTFTIAGFVTSVVNNGTFVASASSATVLTLENAAGVAETHAATATEEGKDAFVFVSRNATYATVSPAGVITAVKQGNAVIEASYPVFDNSLGNGSNDGTPAEKVYAEILVNVVP